MPKQTILYCVTKSSWGGAQRYVYDLATNLPPEHFTVAVACGGHGQLVDKLQARSIPVFTITHLGRDINLRHDLLSLWSLARIIRQVRPDILHLNSPKIAGLGALIGRGLRVKKIIFTNHGWAFNELRPRWQQTAIKFLHWLTMLLSHQTITVSRHDADQVSTWPGLGRKISTIHNGINLINFVYREDARAELIRRAPDLRHNKRELWIGSIGELHPNKGYDYAFQIIGALRKYYPHITYVVIGDGEQESALQTAINQAGLKQTIFLTGRLDEASRYLKAFDLFLLTSRKEGLPYVVLEAGEAELAVAAARVGGIGEIISSPKLGLLIDPANTTESVDAILPLLANSLEREILGRNLGERIRKTFSTERMVSETIALYNEAV